MRDMLFYLTFIVLSILTISHYFVGFKVTTEVSQHEIIHGALSKENSKWEFFREHQVFSREQVNYSIFPYHHH